MKFLLFIMIAIQSFAFTTQDIEDLRYSIKDTKFPQKVDKVMIITNISILTEGSIKLFVQLDDKEFQKMSQIVPTKKSIEDIKYSILGEYKVQQIKALCAKKESRSILDRDISFIYDYSFKSGLKLGETKVNKIYCKNIKMI